MTLRPNTACGWGRVKWNGCGEVRNDDTTCTFKFLFRFNRVWINSRLLLLLYANSDPFSITKKVFSFLSAPIMFSFSLFIFFYSLFVFRKYSTDFRKIFRNCVFWCSLNNPVVLKLLWCNLVELNAKNICSKFQGLTQIFDYGITSKRSKTIQFMFSRSRNPFPTFLLSCHVWVTSKIQVNFRFNRYSDLSTLVAFCPV